VESEVADISNFSSYPCRPALEMDFDFHIIFIIVFRQYFFGRIIGSPLAAGFYRLLGASIFQIFNFVEA
jgi:hypothetical protein